MRYMGVVLIAQWNAEDVYGTMRIFNGMIFYVMNTTLCDLI